MVTRKSQHIFNFNDVIFFTVTMFFSEDKIYMNTLKADILTCPFTDTLCVIKYH